MEEKELLTTVDVAMLLGALELIKSYAHHLAIHVNEAIKNYESADYNGEQFKEDADAAADNCEVIDDCINIVRKVIPKMVKMFNN
jgi:hypothetical protein